MTQKNPEMDKLLSNAARDISGAFAARFCALGIELGLFKAIAETDGLTSAELSQVTGFNERYVREWVYGVSLAGYLEFDQRSRKASMTDEQKLLLVTEGNRFAQYGAFQVANSALLPYAELKDVFRNGGGLEFTTYPIELWRGLDHTGCTRYRNFLVEDWLPHLIEVPKKLRSGGTFADFGCGTGRSTIELAKLFPDAKFYGFDAFDKNINMANENVEEAGGLSNIEFKHWKVEDGSPGKFDVVATFDLIHDLPMPGEGLEVVRKSLSKDGVFLLMDIEATDDPMDNEGPLTLFKLGMSLHFCMTTAIGQGGDGMGTVGLSQSVLNELCASVGFTKVNKIPIRHPLNSLFEIQV